MHRSMPDACFHLLWRRSDDGLVSFVQDEKMIAAEEKKKKRAKKRRIRQKSQWHDKMMQGDWSMKITPAKAKEWHYGITLNEDGVPLMWKRLFLHTACSLGAPDHFIEKLLKAFPEAATQADPYSGALPLHLACHSCREGNASIRTLELLLETNMAAARTPDNQGRLPLHWLMLLNNVVDNASVSVLVRAFPESGGAKDHNGKTPLDYHRIRRMSLDLTSGQ